MFSSETCRKGLQEFKGPTPHVFITQDWCQAGGHFRAKLSFFCNQMVKRNIEIKAPVNRRFLRWCILGYSQRSQTSCKKWKTWNSQMKFSLQFHVVIHFLLVWTTNKKRQKKLDTWSSNYGVHLSEHHVCTYCCQSPILCDDALQILHIHLQL